MEKIYKGIAISETLPNGRTAGEIQIQRTGFYFKSDKGEVTYPLSGLKIEAGGSSGKLLFFTHDKKKGWSVYTDDTSILKNEFIMNEPTLQSTLLHLNKKNQKSRMAAGAMLISFIIGLYLTYLGLTSAKDFAIKKIAEKIPIAWEEKLGSMATSGVLIHTVRNQSMEADLKKITSPIVNQVNLESARKYKYKFIIVDDKVVNAFALPGGTVFINSGLILKADSSEELAGVIAHEISHVTRQHGVRQIIQSLGLYLIVQTMLGDVQGILAVLLENSGFLMNLKFSRDFEREADDSGFKYLVDARVNPEGMVSFFKKLQEEEKKLTGGDVAIPSIVSTHPATQERISFLEKKLKNIKQKSEFSKINVDYKKFKNKVKRAIDSTEVEK